MPCLQASSRLVTRELGADYLWGACENGSHYRRDVSLGEDACRIGKRTAAYVMTTLRNLVLGLFELQQHRGKTKARTFPGWRRQLTDTQKVQLLIRSL